MSKSETGDLASNDSKKIADFFFETGMLQRTPRSGFFVLGSGKQSVAEHLHRTSVIAFTLAKMSGLDPYKAATMALFHDMSESRISDLNHLNQRYAKRDEEKAHNEIYESVPIGNDLKVLIDEYEERKTEYAIIVKDSDTLEWILSLKEQLDIGSIAAKTWIEDAVARLKTEIAKSISKEILGGYYNDWYTPYKTLPKK